MNTSTSIFTITLLFIAPLFVKSQEKELAATLNHHVCVLADDSLQGRGLGTIGRIKAQNYIVNEFEKAGVKKFGDSYLLPFRFRQNIAWIDGQNIAGYIPGSDPILKDEYIVVGAHYDHLGYEVKKNDTIYYIGADDNASGTAAVIELAKHFASLEEAPKRSIIFVLFDAEESGLHGSIDFANNPPVAQENIKLMFSLDMVGMLSSYKGLDLKGLGLLKDSEAIAEKHATTLGIKLKDKSAVVEQQTDTAPFGKAGIPSVHVFTGLESPYHKPEDKCDLLDYDGMALVVKFMQAALVDYANVNELVPSVKPEKLVEGGKAKFISAAATFQHGWGTHDFVNDFYRGRSVYNVAAGASLRFRITKNLGLYSQFLGDFNGSNSFDGSLRRLSFTAPVMLQLGTSDNSQFFRAYLNLGGFYRNNLMSWMDGEQMEFTNGFEQEEWGVNVGVGIQIMKFDIYYTYRRSLSENRIQGASFQDINQMLGVSYRLF